MRLTVIGCSGSYPGPESPASCYLVESEHEGRTWRILLDLGSGALGPLQRYVDPLAIDAVFLSHLHADHCLDLCGYYVLRRFHPTGPKPRLPVYGPEGTAERMARAYDLQPLPGMTGEFDFHVLDEQKALEVGPMQIDVANVQHPVDAFAIRVQVDDRSFVYSGDTGPAEALVRLAKDTDLLLAEASFVEGDPNPPDLHLTGKDAAEAAAQAGAGRLVLTHIPPWHDKQAVFDDARPAYDGPLELACTGSTYDV